MPDRKIKAVKEKELQLQRLEHCPLCGSSQRNTVFEIPHTQVWECHACHLKYLDPCLSPKSMKEAYESDETLMRYHSFHEGYYDYGDLFQESQTLTEFKKGLNLIEKWVPPSSSRSLFEVGFGNGLFLALAKQRGWQVNGVDSSRANVQRAREKYDLSLLHGDFRAHEDFTTLYDAVCFWDVIEHLSEPRLAIQKARRMLKPEGVVLIGLPNDRSFLALLSSWLYRLSFGRIRKGIETFYVLEHIAYYTAATLKRLLERDGFVWCDSFLSRTDLAKYSLSPFERFAAQGILWLGRLIRLENRLIAVFRKQP